MPGSVPGQHGAAWDSEGVPARGMSFKAPSTPNHSMSAEVKPGRAATLHSQGWESFVRQVFCESFCGAAPGELWGSQLIKTALGKEEKLLGCTQSQQEGQCGVCEDAEW